ncbi:MAG: beta-ketoacyl-[acyl-carrier-protein] synthase family protein [Gammaproteobacteria bacterium]|nr:beta-ketoacyl-[acyl-carrier-protein] synthase family protein [Gammaproteobacteria bacterium]
MKNKIYISDFGLVNALGNDKETIKFQLLAGSQAGFNLSTALLNDGNINVAVVSAKLPSLAEYPLHFHSRNNQLALMAIEQIRAEINDVVSKYGSERIAIVVGTSTSGIGEGEQAMKAAQQQAESIELPTAFGAGFDYRTQEMFNLADFVAHELAISGLALTISTACSSSAKAFQTAYELIDNGLADAAIVGGVDATCGMTVNGFSALESTSAGLCQPSSANRDGINIGEGAALCVLRKDQGTIRLLGVGESSDAHHMSAPHPEGDGAVVAMQHALDDAGYSASDVDYINLHGTATPKNDEMEAKAVARLFGLETPCSSSKGMIGHTLGAAGATEVGLCWLLLDDNNRYYAPHVWDNVRDPLMPMLNFVAVGRQHPRALKTCLSNSFAFGGNNVSVLIGL